MNRVKEVNRVYLITVIVAVLGSFVMSVFEPLIKNYFFALMFSQVLLIIPMLFYIIITKQNILEVIRLKKIKTVNMFLAIVFAFLITPLMTLLNLISLLFSTNVIDDTVTNVVENNPLFLSLFIIAFIPCIFEEAVYRGVFFHEYRKVNPLKAVVLSGLLFGLLHMNFNQFIYAFAMGVVFAVMIEATDSILTTMIIHFTINGSSVVMTYMMPRIEDLIRITYGNVKAAELFPDTVEYTASTLIPLIISYAFIATFTTVLAVLLMILMSKIQGRWDGFKFIFRKQERNQDVLTEGIEGSSIGQINHKIGSLSLLIGIVICVIIMIWIEVTTRM